MHCSLDEVDRRHVSLDDEMSSVEERAQLIGKVNCPGRDCTNCQLMKSIEVMWNKRFEQ